MEIGYFFVFMTVVGAIIQVSTYIRLYKYMDADLARRPEPYKPKASIILPCKGLDPDFKKNIERLFVQDYPHFQIIFAVAEESDPAYKPLFQLCQKHPGRADIVVAGFHPHRAQKVNNQLCALQLVQPDSEVIAFVDSDVIALNNFLTHLVAPLKDNSIGVTTGYRFYVSNNWDLPSIIRGFWNRMSSVELIDKKYAFAWGGAMAVRREVFERARIAEHWDNSADDDMSLTKAIKELGLKVHFVTKCTVTSEGRATIAEILEWTNRQMILTKVYYPELWRRAIGRSLIMLLWTVFMFWTLFLAIEQNSQDLFSAFWLGVAIFPLEVFLIMVSRSLWNRILGVEVSHMYEPFWLCCIAVPLAHICLPFMTLYSILTNKVLWRGVTYNLKSATELVIE
jgi:cellulose synthase/poly-beta-1,6-N-acetylglucosamine synthase-like glycosyltransferase